MAKQIEIFINDQLVDVPQGGIRFDTTYSIADISKIDQRNSSITKTLTLPGTARNRRIFGFADDLNSTTGIDQTVKPDARIEIDGVTVLKGAFKITDIVMNDTNSIASYKGVIIGDNGSWKLLINDLKLSDLDLSDQNHIYDVPDIDASETLIDSRDYVYPLINYGAWFGSGTVAVEDRFPAIRIKRLMKQIFKDQGFNMESAFFDSDFGKRLFLPFTRKTTRSDETFADDKLFRVGQLAGSQVLTHPTAVSAYLDLAITGAFGEPGFFDPNNLIDVVANEYTATAYQVANLIVQVRIQSSADDEFRLIIQKERTTIGFENLATTRFTQSDVVYDFVKVETGFINISPGDVFKIKMEYFGASCVVDQGVFFNDVSLQLARGAEVSLTQQLPDVFQLDFLQGIKTLFNLYFDTDIERRTVTVETFDDFYTNQVIDWSGKLDMMSSRSVKYLGANVSKNIVYDYREDSRDAPVEQILDRDDSFAEHQAISTNVFARDGETRVTSIFAPTLMATATTIGFTESLIPKMWKDLPNTGLPDKSTDFQPRILFYDGVQANVTDEEWIWEGTTRTDFPRMYFYDEVNDNDNNLMFKTLRRSHGLFEKYYRNSQKLLNEGRIFVGVFKLNDVDISNLDFRKRIKLILNGEEKIFLLNKVTGYNGEGLTKVELITDVGTQQLTQVTTTADDPNILPPQFQPTPDAASTGIIATVGGVIVPVYSTDTGGNFFWVQSTLTQQGTNGG